MVVNDLDRVAQKMKKFSKFEILTTGNFPSHYEYDAALTQWQQFAVAINPNYYGGNKAGGETITYFYPNLDPPGGTPPPSPDNLWILLEASWVTGGRTVGPVRLQLLAE